MCTRFDFIVESTVSECTVVFINFISKSVVFASHFVSFFLQLVAQGSQCGEIFECDFGMSHFALARCHLLNVYEFEIQIV